MIKLTVTTIISSSKSAARSHMWFAFEADYDSFEEMQDALIEERCITGMRVITKESEFGHRIVADRVPHVIGINGIATISPCHFEYIDTPGAPE